MFIVVCTLNKLGVNAHLLHRIKCKFEMFSKNEHYNRQWRLKNEQLRHITISIMIMDSDSMVKCLLSLIG